MLNKWSVAYHLEDVCSQPLCSLSNLFHFCCHNSVHSLLECFGRKNVKCYTKYFAEETHSACWIRTVSPKRRQALFSVGVCLLECMHAAFLQGMCAFVYTTQSSFLFLGLAQFVLLEPCVHIRGSVPTWRPRIYVHQGSFATWRNNGEKQWVNYCSGNPPPWVGSGAESPWRWFLFFPTGAWWHASNPGVVWQRADPIGALAPAEPAHAGGWGDGAEAARS